MSELSTQLFSPENLVDPYPAYKQLRDESPVHFMPEMNLHVVTRYDLLREATQGFQARHGKCAHCAVYRCESLARSRFGVW